MYKKNFAAADMLLKCKLSRKMSNISQRAQKLSKKLSDSAQRAKYEADLPNLLRFIIRRRIIDPCSRRFCNVYKKFCCCIRNDLVDVSDKFI